MSSKRGVDPLSVFFYFFRTPDWETFTACSQYCRITDACTDDSVSICDASFWVEQAFVPNYNPEVNFFFYIFRTGNVE